MTILLISDIQYLILPYTIYIYAHVYVWCKEEKGATEERWLDGIIDSMDMNLSNLWEIMKARKAWCATARGPMGSQRVGHD